MQIEQRDFGKNPFVGGRYVLKGKHSEKGVFFNVYIDKNCEIYVKV